MGSNETLVTHGMLAGAVVSFAIFMLEASGVPLPQDPLFGASATTIVTALFQWLKPPRRPRRKFEKADAVRAASDELRNDGDFPRA